MKILCKTQSLLEYNNIVSKAVSTRTTLPILECILLCADDDGFRLLSNDLELGIETNQIEAEVSEKGSVALDARVYMDIIRRLPNEEVTIETTPQDITTIKSGKTEFKIFGLPGVEYPLIPKVEKNEVFALPSHIFKNMIKQTIFAVSTDDMKPTMMGEKLTIHDNTLTLAAVDGVRLAVKTAPVEPKNGDLNLENAEIIIPAKTLNEVYKILPNDEESMLYMYITDKHVLFELDECRIVSRLIGGEFINYDVLFNDDFKTLITINREYLIDALERAMLISRNMKKNYVKLSVTEETVTITSRTDTGVFTDEISAEIDGNDLEIGFNPWYLTDALKAIETDTVNLQMMSSISPCIIKGVNDDTGKYIVTPVRLMG
jgi:DNA polymerase-3 subunit beta